MTGAVLVASLDDLLGRDGLLAGVDGVKHDAHRRAAVLRTDAREPKGGYHRRAVVCAIKRCTA